MNVVLQALLFCPPFYVLLDTIRRHVAHKFASQTPLLDSLIDFVREFEVVDLETEDGNPNGPVVGQEHVKDFGDPFIPERVYNGWKGNKDFENMKVCNLGTLRLGADFVAWESRGCRRVSGIIIECGA